MNGLDHVERQMEEFESMVSKIETLEKENKELKAEIEGLYKDVEYWKLGDYEEG